MDNRMDKWIVIQSVRYYITIKKKKHLLHIKDDSTDLTLSERSQKQIYILYDTKTNSLIENTELQSLL